METKEELRNKIEAANAAYRAGLDSGLTDQEYDDILEKYGTLVENDEFEKFKNTLNEAKVGYGSKIKHPWIMGSLEKLKNSDPEALSKFVSKYIKTTISVSAKVDGISCRLHYSDGQLVSAATRGDGYEGIDITDKIKYVKSIPSAIKDSGEVDIRGELVMLKADAVGFKTNPRNVCAGIMNRKDWSKDDVSKVTFVAYTVLGNRLSKSEQFKLLENNGFSVAWHDSIDPKTATCESLTEIAKLKHEYECDGLVLTDDIAINEIDSYRPKNAMAFKINELNATSRIVDISWDGPSEYGFFIPVAVVEPVELGGAVIQRASMHNLDVLDSLGVKYGSVVEIAKSNDIIPQVISVISNENSKPVEFPTECSCCGAKLVRDGVNLKCTNAECPDQIAYQIEHFIKKLGVENASFKTIKNFGIASFEDLIRFVPNKSYKSETKLRAEIDSKIMTRQKRELFCALSMRGLGETLQNKIVDAFGWDTVESRSMPDSEHASLPSGIGEITYSKFLESYDSNLKIVEMITSDSRYRPSAPVIKAEKKGSVCFTGSLSIPRGKASELAEQAGFEVKSSVTKGLTYLVMADPNSTSSKAQKARKLGTAVIGETEFMKLVSNVAGEVNIFEV